jgi:hypothetical protein
MTRKCNYPNEPWAFFQTLTPIEVLKCIKEKSDKCYLPESVEGGEKLVRSVK